MRTVPAPLKVACGLMVACLLALTACGSGTATAGVPAPTATPTSAPTTTPTSAPTAAAPACTPTPMGPATGAAAATIAMGNGRFTGTTSVTIKAGQAVKFDDSQGGPHNLVIGTGGIFRAESGAPAALVPTTCYTGLRVENGDVHIVTFAVAGTYAITCTFHPSMEAMVTVS